MTGSRDAAAALTLFVSACATAPLAPDPTVNISGRWSIVSVNGQPTGGGRNFTFAIEPPVGSARFGCNSGSGSVRVDQGWLVGGRDWIITLALCPGRMDFEHKGFKILEQPLAIERRSSGAIRLRNANGSIDLVRA